MNPKLKILLAVVAVIVIAVIVAVSVLVSGGSDKSKSNNSNQASNNGNSTTGNDAPTSGVPPTMTVPTPSGNLMECDMSTMAMTEDQMAMLGFATTNMGMMTSEEMGSMESMSFKCMNETESPVTYITMDRSTVRNGMTTWFGMMSEDDSNATGHMGFATLVQGKNGTWTGSFTTEMATYDVQTMADGTMRVRRTLWTSFPQETDDMHDEDDETNFFEKLFGGKPDTGENMTVMGNFTVATTFTNFTGNPQRRRGLSVSHDVVERNVQSTSTTVDILVVATNAAYCYLAGYAPGCYVDSTVTYAVYDALILVQEQTTLALQLAGSSTAQVSIVDVIFLDAGYEGQPDSATLQVVQTDTNVLQWRRDAGADLVAMLTGPTVTSGCGIGRLNSFGSVTSVSCLGQYSFTHEVGHNFGCFHDRSNADTTRSAYAFGLQVPSGGFHTVMAYACRSTTRPCAMRIPFFSHPQLTYYGFTIGSTTTNNARQTRARVATIASWSNSL